MTLVVYSHIYNSTISQKSPTLRKCQGKNKSKRTTIREIPYQVNVLQKKKIKKTKIYIYLRVRKIHKQAKLVKHQQKSILGQNFSSAPCKIGMREIRLSKKICELGKGVTPSFVTLVPKQNNPWTNIDQFLLLLLSIKL